MNSLAGRPLNAISDELSQVADTNCDLVACQDTHWTTALVVVGSTDHTAIRTLVSTWGCPGLIADSAVQPEERGDEAEGRPGAR